MTPAALATLSIASPTPGRHTVVALDVAEDVLIEPALYVAREAPDMARTKAAFLDRVRLVPNTGWQVAPIQRSDDATQPDDALGTTALTTAGLLSQIYSLPGSRSPMFQKQVPAGTSSSSSIASDASARPGVGNASVAMDRVIVSNSPLDAFRAFYWRGRYPFGVQVPDVLEDLLFSGPASAVGKDAATGLVGTGYYALRRYGNGIAILFEEASIAMAAAAWRPVPQSYFHWAPQQGIAGYLHEMEVIPYTYATRLDGYGGAISIRCHHAERAPALLALFRPGDSDTQTFTVKVRQDFDPAATPDGKLRIDQRSDLRPLTQLAPAVYPTTAYLYCDPIVSEGVVGNGTTAALGKTLRLSWRANKPSGCDVVGDLLNNGTVLSSVSSGSDGSTFWKEYDIPSLVSVSTNFGLPVLVPRFTFTTTGATTPTLTFMRTSKQTFTAVNAPGEFILDGVAGRATPENLRLSQGGEDPGSDSGSFDAFDETGLTTLLRGRGSFACEVRTTVTPATGSPKTTVLFKGRAQVTEAPRVGADDPLARHAAGGARRVGMALVGPWARLEEAFAPQIIDFMIPKDEGASAGLPWKITDALNVALGFSGVPSRAIDMPDLSTRFYLGQDGTRLEPGASLAEFVRRTAREMLGAVVVFDPNAKRGTDSSVPPGMWRLVRPPVAPYKVLAAFVRGPRARTDTAAGTVVDGSGAGSYPPTTVPAGLYNAGATVPTTFLARAMERPRIKPPEANYITVVGGAPDQGGRGGRIAVHMLNPKSYAGVPGQTPPVSDSTNPDYLGRCVPLRVVDSRLQTKEGLWFACRRLYGALAYGRVLSTFTAPLILVTDPADTLQIAPRPLRIGDCILVEREDGTFRPWVVRRVTIGFRKDHKQYADYEVELPSDARDFSYGKATGPQDVMRRAARQAAGRVMGYKIQDTFVAPGEAVRHAYAGEAERIALIESFIPQVLDPSLPNFGTPLDPPTWV